MSIVSDISGTWLAMLWSMIAAACLTLAVVHGLVWWRWREAVAHAFFSMAAVGTASLAACELWLMRARTPYEFGLALRWGHLPVWVVVISLVLFVRFYLREGRPWLAWTVCGFRTFTLILNFAFWPNLNFRQISALRQVDLFGQIVSVPQGVTNPWMLAGQFSLLLLVVFVADATVAAWRHGERRKAVLVGGSIIFFVTVGLVQSVLIWWGFISAPLMASPFFMGIVAVMGSELSRGVVRAAQLAGELRSSEERMALAASAAELGLWDWDLVRDEIWITNEGRRLLGLPASGRINENRFLGLLHPDDRDTVRQAMANTLTSGLDYQVEYRVPCQDGRMRWMTARGRLEHNRQGRPVLLRGVSIDITSRKLAEERFRLVVEAIPSAMVMVGADGRIALVNAQTEAVFGYPRGELIGKDVESLIPERLRAKHERERREYLRTPEARSMGAGRDLFARRRDGSEFPVEIGLVPVRVFDAQWVLASISDMTRRRQAEVELARQRNELAHLSRLALAAELSGSLAHELNQPLTAILVNAQAAQQYLTGDPEHLNELRGALQDIIDDDKRAGEVIRRLLLLFRKGEIQHQQLHLNDLVREVLKLANGDLVNHGVNVDTDLAAQLELIEGDRVQLQQVLLNLITNACDAMGMTEAAERHLLIRTRSMENGTVEISIIDRGCGIADEQMQKIFEPFQTSKPHGMGVGLAVCRTVIKAHGGRLWATNNPDRGATFHVELPTTPFREG